MVAPEPHPLEAAIAALEAQRPVLGDAVVDLALAPLRAQWAAAQTPGDAPAPAQVLRQVSILFMDMVGSIRLSRRLDPEGVSAVMDGALARGTALVQAQGGRVLQYAGDNLLAVFGAEGAREDDAERAVLCGLALLALGRELGAEVQAAHGEPGFDVRVGVHTGGVLLGGGLDAEGSIRGQAVNIAARMEQTAPPGGLRISHDTYALVRGMFEVEPQPPLEVKGLEAPVASVLVRRARPRPFRIALRGIEGVATQMVGREAEQQALQQAFLGLVGERRLAAVTLVAEAGVGKTRLLQEFAAWCEHRPEPFVLFRGRATPQTAVQAFGLLRDILAWRFQIQDDDSLEAARRKMEAGIVPLFLADEGAELAEAHAHLLGHLVGIEWRESRHLAGILGDPGQIRRRALHAAVQLFARIGGGPAGHPVLLQLEDLHWADDESLDFLNLLAERLRDHPLLLLASTRPALFERRTDWRSTEGVHQRLDLASLGPEGSERLARELLKHLPQVPPALLQLLTQRAEGNPFYMEELLKMLIDQGAVVPGEPWTVHAERLRLTQLPATLTGVLQARLDGLPAAERRALQQASIVGTVFWDRALAAVDDAAPAQLPSLVQRELALPRADAALEGLREYAFRHQLLHQVTYDTVLKRHKREWHAGVARWLAGLADAGGLRGGDFLGLAAEHFEQAGEPLRAAEFHTRAAEQAGARLAHARVLDHVERGLALLVALPAQERAGPGSLVLQWRLRLEREDTLDMLSRRDEQATELAALRQLADALDDDVRRALVARRMAHRAMRMGDRPEQERASREALALAEKVGQDGIRLQALRMLAGARMWQGDRDGARTLARQGLADARRLKLRAIEGHFLTSLSILAEMEGDLVGGVALDQESLVIDRETGDRVNEAIDLCNLGGGWTTLGERVQGRLALEAALQLLRANGDRTMESLATLNLSALTLMEGDADEAAALAHQACELAAASHSHSYESSARLRLGNAELARGRRAEARAAFERSLALARATGHPGVLDGHAALARLALAEGDAAAALAAVQPLLDRVATGGSLDGATDPRLIEWSCHQALARAGDPRAAAWLARAHGALMAQADAITDPALRQGFLQNIPCHREIVAAVAGQG